MNLNNAEQMVRKGWIISNGSLVSRRQAEQSTSGDTAGSSTGEDQMSS